MPKRRKVKKRVLPWVVHYRYNKKAICGGRTAKHTTHLLSVVSCKRCKNVIRGMLRVGRVG